MSPQFPLKNPMRIVTIRGIDFPVETNEEVAFLIEETEGKDVTDTLIVLGDWLRACITPDPTEDLEPMVEG